MSPHATIAATNRRPLRHGLDRANGNNTKPGASHIPWLNQNTLLKNGMAANTKPSKMAAYLHRPNSLANDAGRQNAPAVSQYDSTTIGVTVAKATNPNSD